MRWVRVIMVGMTAALLAVWVLSTWWLVTVTVPMSPAGSFLHIDTMAGRVMMSSNSVTPVEPAEWGIDVEPIQQTDLDGNPYDPYAETPYFEFARFSISDPQRGLSLSGWSVILPLWLLVLAAGAWPAISLGLFIRRRWFVQGVCLGCGYDLRGSPSGVCPECGEESSQSNMALKEG